MFFLNFDRVPGMLSSLGKCSRCMKLAFTAAIAATLVTAILYIAAPLWLALGAAGASIALIALWVAHVWFYTMRSIRATAALAPQSQVAARQEELWPRRRVLRVFIRTLIFSAMISVLPRSAYAQECNCYTEDNCSCPPDFPNCIFNPSTGDAICCGPNAVGCAGPQQTWCCPPGTNCYGTEGQCSN
ncbi:MAG: hypothetical protein ABL973_00345 [Micropepsaceae bacterium]